MKAWNRGDDAELHIDEIWYFAWWELGAIVVIWPVKLYYMEVIGTKEAFIALISQRGFAKAYEVDKTLVSMWKSGSRIPTIDKMEEVLTAAGSLVIKEKIWDVKYVNRRTKFTQKEILLIEKLILKIQDADEKSQKNIRGKLWAQFHFYLEDFTKAQKFTSKDLDKAIIEGAITVID